MGKRLQLTIDEPCHEDWDQMTPSEQGHFCSSCQKHVIDFSTMSDTQLVAFFKKPPQGSVCGRFFSDQLDRAIDIPKKRIPWVKYFFQFALPAFLASAKVAAQGNVTVKNKRVEAMPPKPAPQNNASVENAVSAVKISITGKVVGENNDSLPFATVKIKGTQIARPADAKGMFKMEDIQFSQGMVLEISYAGYVSEERVITIESGTVQDMFVQLKLKPVTTEAVVIVSAPVYRKGGITWIYSAIRSAPIPKTVGVEPEKPTIEVYPNPVQRNSTVNIQWQHTKDETAKLTVIGMGGNLVLSQSQRIAKGFNRISVLADGRWAAGVYIVQLLDEKGEVIKKEKLVVQ